MGRRRTALWAMAGAAALTGSAVFGEAVEDCASIEDRGPRLACFDGLAGPPQPAQAPAADAGGPVSPGGAAEVIQSTIILLDRRAGGELVFRLANGQAWTQQAAHFIAVEAGERVVIARARLGGGHILATERSAATRVRRLEQRK